MPAFCPVINDITKREISNLINENEDLKKIYEDIRPEVRTLIFAHKINVWKKRNSTEDEPTAQQLLDYIKESRQTRKNLSLANEFGAIGRQEVVNLVTRRFQELVEDELNSKKEYLERMILESQDNNEKLTYALQKSKLTEAIVLKDQGLMHFFNMIRKELQDFVDNDREQNILAYMGKLKQRNPEGHTEDQYRFVATMYVNRKEKTYRKMLQKNDVTQAYDIFTMICEEAASNFGITEGISVSIDNNFELIDVNEFLKTDEGNTVTDDGMIDEDSPSNFDSEEKYYEGWMTDVHEVPSFSSLSPRIRRMISHMKRQKRGKDGKYKDDISSMGDFKYYDASYVYSELIQALREMTDVTDMIPILEELSKKKSWVRDIIRNLTEGPEGNVKEANKLMTDFYRCFRKDYVEYWIQKLQTQSDGSIKVKTITINKSEGTAHYFDEWRDNLEYGNLIDPKDSVYNFNGEFRMDKAKVGKLLVEDLYSKIYQAENGKARHQVLKDNISIVKKLMNMLGIDISDDLLNDTLDTGAEEKIVNIAGAEVDMSYKNLSGMNLVEFLRTIYGDMVAGNERVKDGTYVDLINVYGSAFNGIAEIINKVDEDTVESSVRQGDKTRYAHINPSYMTTLIKKLKNESKYQDVLDMYRQCPWFFDIKTGEWRNDILENVERSKDFRKTLSHMVLLEHDRKEYASWSEKDSALALIKQYDIDSSSSIESYAYYQSPMLSDVTSAEFIKLKRYKGKDYKDTLLDKFCTLVLQELDRIDLVKTRAEMIEKGEILPEEFVASFDMSADSLGGAEFKFLPELNDIPNFIKTIDYKKLNETDKDVRDYIKSQIHDVLNRNVQDSIEKYKSIGLYERTNEENEHSRYKYFDRYEENSLNSVIEEYVWNSMYAQSQIIQLLTTDLAYYKNMEDFQKRAKEFHAPTQKLNTLAEWNGERVLEDEIVGYRIEKDAQGNPIYDIVYDTDKDGNTLYDAMGNPKIREKKFRKTPIKGPRMERSVYVADAEHITSRDVDKIEKIMREAGKDSKEISVILSGYRTLINNSRKGGVNETDGQAYRNLSSYRRLCIMAGEWSDDAETAYQHFKDPSGAKWTAADFVAIWNTKKPYLYTQTLQDDGTGKGTYILKPNQNKNSEMLLLTDSIFGHIFGSGKLRAMDDFMEKHNIDVIEFNSCVKTGNSGVIDINSIDDYDDVMKELEYQTGFGVFGSKEIQDQRKYDSNIHRFDYNDYGLQTATPEHAIDHMQLVGSQIRRLIDSDIDPDTEIEVPGYKGKMKVRQWRAWYNAVNTANVRDAFEELDKKFEDIHEIKQLLEDEIRNNPRYGMDLLNALRLDENDHFSLSLLDPTQTIKIQALLNSVIKTRITKQKIAGAALIQASPYGLIDTDDSTVKGRKPRIVYDTDSNGRTRIKYIEAYVPCPSQELYEKLLIPGTHEIDIDKTDENGDFIIPEEYKEMIGYRVPTENKYSMVPVKVIGFLPRQCGDVIILPQEWTTISGSDFDVDKLYVMMRTLKSRSDFRSDSELEEGFKDYYAEKMLKDMDNMSDTSIMETIMSTGVDLEDPDIRRQFNIWKSGYEVNKFNYDAGDKEYKDSKRAKFAEKVQELKRSPNRNLAKIAYYTARLNSKKQRDEMIISSIWGILTNADTASKMLDPGGFVEQKRSGRIISILKTRGMGDEEGNFKDLSDKEIQEILDSSLGTLEDELNKVKKPVNPLNPITWVDLQQRNMSGASLISIAAVNNAGHALLQHTNVNFSSRFVMMFNAKNSAGKILTQKEVYDRLKYSPDSLDEFRHRSLHDYYDVDGRLITKNTGGFLAAFVDNGKDPIAGDMNFNTITANMAFALLRSGVSPMTTALVLSQPALVQAVKMVQDSNISMKQALMTLEESYKNLLGPNAHHSKAVDYNYNDIELAKNIAAYEEVKKYGTVNSDTFIHAPSQDIVEFPQRQLQVIRLLKELNKMGQAVSDLTNAIRSDSQSGGAGPDIATDVLNIQKLDKVLIDNDPSDPKAVLENVDFIDRNLDEEQIADSPISIQQAFFTYGTELTKKMFEKYFPYFGKTYMYIVNTMAEDSKYGKLTAKQMNSIYNDFVSYMLTKADTIYGESTTRAENENVKIWKGLYSREEVAKETDKVFLFGDNTEDRTKTHHVPTSTQAVIRGLPNAIGIDTKKTRFNTEDAFFTDDDFDAFKAQVDSAIKAAEDSGKIIIIPEDGIGTGKAQLKMRAPKCYAYLQERLAILRNAEAERLTVPGFRDRDFYINRFPEEFRRWKEESNSQALDLSIIARLKTSKVNQYNPVAKIYFTNVGNVTDLQKEGYKRDFEAMLRMSPEERAMARKLFIYNCFRGFGFHAQGFANLMPVEMKLDCPEYIATLHYLESLANAGVDIEAADNFIDQYKLNHPDDSKFVPDMTKSTFAKNIDSKTTMVEIQITPQSSVYDKSFIRDFDDDMIESDEAKQLALPFIDMFKVTLGRNRYAIFKLDRESVNGTKATYVRMKERGKKNEYVEYMYGVPASQIETVIDEAQKIKYDDSSAFAESNIDGVPEGPESGEGYLDSLTMNDAMFYMGLQGKTNAEDKNYDTFRDIPENRKNDDDTVQCSHVKTITL